MHLKFSVLTRSPRLQNKFPKTQVILLYVCKRFSILGKNHPLFQKQTLKFENSNDINNDNANIHLCQT